MERCRWVSSDQARVLPGRHEDGCEDETCRGCQPCTMDHCRVCTVEHSSGACGGCLAEVREGLTELRQMCGALPEEVETRGIDGEAMNLLGPAADPEARGHWEASVLAGRIVPVDCDARDLHEVRAWLETAAHELHPLIVIGGWAIVYRDTFEHSEPVGRVDVLTETGYLERNLTEMAEVEFVPFEDFARDLRRCVGHMEQVLGNSDRGERTNIDCLDCGAALERRLGAQGFEDVATCRGCRRRYTGPEYNFAVEANLIDRADWLGDQHMAQRTGVPATTVRSWARAPKSDDDEPLVRKDVQLGRTVYSVADVERVRDNKGLAPCA